MVYPQLVGVSGPAEGILALLGPEETTIGRHSTNTVCIRERSVSRHHCLIRIRDGAYYLSDLDSRNGTLLNGEAVTGERLLTGGDRIALGDAVFRFVTSESNAGATNGSPQYDGEGWESTTFVIDREEVLRITSATFSPPRKLGERTEKTLKAILAIGKMLSSLSQVEAVQAQLFDLLSDIIPSEAGALLLIGYGGSEPTLASGWNRAGQAAEPLRISRTLTTRVIEDGIAVLRSRMSDECAAPASVIARAVTSVLCVPLIVRGSIHGAIYLETTHPIQRFDQEHLKLLTAISGYAALALDHARRVEQLERENGRLRSASGIHHAMVGRSRVMSELYERIRKISGSDATVLIIGESGTGKELVARAIHENSGRVAEPFEAINCALLRETLLESELFGHEKGSFTGASTQKKGKLEIADRGTVFLDEIGELTEAPQSMLLRVLQEREFTRVGGTRSIHVDIRLIAATNRDLENAVKQGRFREDLFYRIGVICLRVAPLRERREDIPELAEYFLAASVQRNKRAVSAIAPKAMAALMSYSWPGNVRELQNAVEYAVVFGSADQVLPEDLPEHLLNAKPSDSDYVGAYSRAVRHARQEIVLNALKRASYDYAAAARELEIHVNNIHRLIRELDLRVRIPGPPEPAYKTKTV